MAALALLAFHCGGGQDQADPGPSGGAIGTGGSSATGGGNVSSGGISTTTGGTLNTGGTPASLGGSTATGGAAPSTGGASTSGGTTSSTGGAITGGSTTITGGATSSGGTGSATGGKASTGGSTSGGGGSSSTSGGSPSTGGSGGASGDAYYISPTGLDTNPGTQAQPFLTLGKANQVAKAGTTIWVMAGTFKYSTTMTLDKKGSMALPIKVWAVTGARPILDFSGQPRGNSSARGIELKGDYFHIRGLEVMKAGDNGIAISGAYNTVEDVILHGNEDTGLQITVPSGTVDNSRGANNLILNCDSYENLDTATGGENADGFAAKLRIGAGNVFRGCRAWNNADDGWDLFAANDIVQIDDCWAFLNGKPSAGGNPAGDGNGFKLGGAPDASDPDQGGAVHVVTNSTAFDNAACGFVRNNNPSVPKLTTCGVHANKTDYCQVTCTPSKTIQTSGEQAKTLPRTANGSLPAIP
jgi:hypothetical protein